MFRAPKKFSGMSMIHKKPGWSSDVCSFRSLRRFASETGEPPKLRPSFFWPVCEFSGNTSITSYYAYNIIIRKYVLITTRWEMKCMMFIYISSLRAFEEWAFGHLQEGKHKTWQDHTKPVDLLCGETQQCHKGFLLVCLAHSSTQMLLLPWKPESLRLVHLWSLLAVLYLDVSGRFLCIFWHPS